MANRLATETSPYLQQHADNPVDWQPWSAEALAQARELDRPILLSIGYSACHWCHVMAHESFEDDAVAAVMNRLFVNIKVDREERPDLDQIYQAAQQLLTGRNGGWPLTMFLTPAGVPFYGGTYFPKTARYGLPGFAELLERVAAGYAAQRQQIEGQNVQLRQALDATVPKPSAAAGELDGGPIAAAREALRHGFDAVNGGFGPAPKFPHTGELAMLLRRAAGDGDAEAGQMALTTLARMARGGIYDQLGGGFCRYSVDERWEIPHFEKMLYDNALLLPLYADAWAASGEPLFKRTAEGIAGWVLREMQSPDGGYYSSIDADSEGEEGRFYVWSREEVETVLDAAEYAVAARHWGLAGSSNFENNHWHLRVAADLPAEQETLLEAARRKLFALREGRVHPGRDEKVLTSWNALMIEGMAHAARVFDRPEWLASARRALEFVKRMLWRQTGAKQRLLATCKDGRAHLDAYLDDHAFLIAALLEMLQADYRSDDLAFAQTLAQTLLEDFEDREAGGFFFTRHDHEALIHRPKPGYDNATPSGNGVAAQALQRLAVLDGNRAWSEAAAATLRLFAAPLRAAGGAVSLLRALEDHLQPPQLVVLSGPAAVVRTWQAQLAAAYLPRALVLAPPAHEPGLPPQLDRPATAAVEAWVCTGLTCLPPISDWQELKRCLAAVP